jgi:hypothetical protein
MIAQAFEQSDVVKSPFEIDVRRITDGVADLLVEKNKKYGDSAMKPKRIFSSSDSIEGLKIRIDDKLSRIATSGSSATDEDTLMDLIGYLILLKIAESKTYTPKGE